MAVKDKSTLIAELLTQFPNNTVGSITPTVLRNQQTDTIDSMHNGDNFIVVQALADLPTAAAGVITLEDAKTYYITTEIDLGTDRIVMGNNTTILSYGAGQGRLTTNNANATITFPGFFNVATIRGGIRINNTGGPAIKCESNCIAFIKETLHTACTTAVEIDGALLADIDGCSPTGASAANGISVTGACDTVYIRSFTPFNVTGYGVNISSSSCDELRIDRSPMDTTGRCIDFSGTIKEFVVSNSDLTSATAEAMYITGTITGTASFLDAINESTLGNCVDITSSTLNHIIMEDIHLEAPAGYSLVGDAGSANITNTALFLAVDFNGVSGPLSGITAKDLKYTFQSCLHIPDTKVQGFMYFGGPGASLINTTLTDNVPIIMDGSATSGAQNNRWSVIVNPNNGAGSALQYDGIEDFEGTCVVSFDGEKDGAGTPDMEFGVYKNAGAEDGTDTPISPPRFIEGTNNAQSISFIIEVTAETGDIFDVRIKRLSSGANWETRNFAMSIS